MKRVKFQAVQFIWVLAVVLLTAVPQSLYAQQINSANAASAPKYNIGVGDILHILVTQPEEISIESTVSPDGYITFPYIGSVYAKDQTLDDIQQKIQNDLSDGYLRYPVVTVALKESNSKNFFVYGEVKTPGSYPITENMTVFRALSVAGGFTKFGSSSRVKLLRPKSGGPGYDLLKVDMKAILEGKTEADMPVIPGDVVVISEGVF